MTAFILAVSAGPRLLPYRTYAIESGSMAPTLPAGSLVVVRPVRADQLRTGDIITFRRPDDPRVLVTHRIVRIEHGRDVFVTQGDANGVPDAWRVRASGTGWRYSFGIPYAGYGVEALALPLARVALLGVVVLLFGATAVRRIWKPAGEAP